MYQTAENGADVLYHRAKFGGAGTLHTAMGAKLFLSVTLLERQEFVNAVSP